MKKGFFEKYRTPEVEGLPKYALLRETLRKAIGDGYWKIGDQLPSETELTQITPFSLGTVQKALTALVNEGLVERHQGQGTFVTAKRSQMHDAWHFRFYGDELGKFMPVYPRVLLKKQITSQAPWAAQLNPKSGRLIQIDRILDIGGEFSIYSQFFLSADEYRVFLTMSKEELTSVNYKTILRQVYQVSIANLAYSLQMTALPLHICRAIEVAPEIIGLLLEIMATAGSQNPVYFQKVYIPPNKRRLYISDSSSLAEYWL